MWYRSNDQKRELCDQQHRQDRVRLLLHDELVLGARHDDGRPGHGPEADHQDLLRLLSPRLHRVRVVAVVRLSASDMSATTVR